MTLPTAESRILARFFLHYSLFKKDNFVALVSRECIRAEEMLARNSLRAFPELDL